MDGQVFTKLFTYSLSLRGESGYTWIKYADSPTEGMSDSADGKKYIGMAFNKVTDTESDDYEDYQWSLMPQNIITEGRNYVLDSDRGEVFPEPENLPTDSNDYPLVHLTYDLSEPLIPNTNYLLSYSDPLSTSIGVYSGDRELLLGEIEKGQNSVTINAEATNLVIGSWEEREFSGGEEIITVGSDFEDFPITGLLYELAAPLLPIQSYRLTLHNLVDDRILVRGDGESLMVLQPNTTSVVLSPTKSYEALSFQAFSGEGTLSKISVTAGEEERPWGFAQMEFASKLNRLALSAKDEGGPLEKLWLTRSNHQMGWSLAPEDIRSEIDESRRITVEFIAPNGLVYKKGSDIPITIEARVLKGSLDITGNFDIAVKWTRSSTNSALDEVFNLADRSGRLLTLDSNDLGDGGTYHCNVYFITTQSLLDIDDKAITVFPAENGDDTSLDVVALGDLWLTSDVTVTVDTQDLISQEIISVREEISHGKEIIDEVDRLGHTLSSVKTEISTIEINNGRLGRQVVDVITAQTSLQNSIIETSEGVKRTVSSISGLKSNLVSVEQTVKDLTISVKDGGGSNLLLNSVGYAGLNFWQRGAGHFADPLTTVSSWVLQGVSKHGWTFADEEGVAKMGHIYQGLSLTAGQDYTVTGRAIKKTQADYFGIDVRSTTGTTIHSGFSVTGNDQQDHTFTFHFTAPQGTEAELHVYGKGFELTDLGCYKGNAPTTWQQYAGEVYTLNVQVDKQGIRVFSENKLSETRMSPEEFSGLYNGNRIFTLNGDLTEVQGLVIHGKGLHLAPIKMIPNRVRNSLVEVWTGF